MRKHKFISIALLIIFLWQNLLGVDALRPMAVGEKENGSLFIPEFGEAAIPRYYGDVLGQGMAAVVMPGDSNADKIAELIRGGNVVVVVGNFADIAAVSAYLYNNKNRLVSRKAFSGAKNVFDKYLLRKEAYRTALLRLVIVVEGEKISRVANAPSLKDVVSRIPGYSEGITKQRFLLPVRVLATLLREEARGIREAYIPILGGRIICLGNVFVPKDHRILRLVAENINFRGKTVLEPFTGTGVLGVYAAMRDATKVVSTDKFREPVECARQNAARFGVADRMSVVQADIFPDGVSADIILANPPWIKARALRQLDESFYDTDDMVIIDFFERLDFHLNKGGRVYVLYSNFSELTHDRKPGFFEKLAEAHGFVVTRRSSIKANKGRTKPLISIKRREMITLYEIERKSEARRSDIEEGPEEPLRNI